MATTTSDLTAGKAIGGLGGNGERHKGRAAALVATAALGIALLTGVVLGQTRHETRPGARLAAPVVRLSPGARERELNLIIEQNTLPELTETRPVMSVEWQYFLEQNTQFPTVGTLAFLPDLFSYREDHRSAAVVAGGAAGNTPTYRESHGLALPPAFVADPFTYREDHRSGTNQADSTGRQQFLAWNLDLPTGGAASATPDQFTYREDHRGDR